MFFLTASMLWSFCYFFLTLYLTTVFLVIVYLLPIVKDFTNFTRYKSNTAFLYITGFDFYWLLITPLVLYYWLTFSWISAGISTWFGHFLFTSFQLKMSFLIYFMLYLVFTVYMSVFYFSSREVYDFISVCFNFFFWILYLFAANTLFTVIFFIEILSTLVFLLLITSTFSTTYYYNNLNLNLHNYFNPTTPSFYLQMLMYFFWISLIASLNLFFFLILFYLKFLSFDWFIFEFIFHYIVSLADYKNLTTLTFIWVNLLFCVFLKCGLVPFYFWKPTFFKGLPFHTLMFYVLFFYFFIFLFFLYFFLSYTCELFYFFLSVNLLLLVIGVFFLLTILCEAYYIKVFFALSSILNTLFVFLAISGVNVNDYIFFV